MSRNDQWNLDNPEIRLLIEKIKNEIAIEYGIQIPADGYWGQVPSKDLGTIGSQLKKRLPLLLDYQNRCQSEEHRLR